MARRGQGGSGVGFTAKAMVGLPTRHRIVRLVPDLSNLSLPAHAIGLAAGAFTPRPIRDCCHLVRIQAPAEFTRATSLMPQFEMRRNLAC